MRRLVPIIVLVLAAGCGDAHRDVAQRQTANFREITEILRSIEDPATMKEAEDRLIARSRHYREVSLRARSLADDPDAVARMEPQRREIEAALKSLAVEVDRVRQLPGGKDFLDRFSATMNPGASGKLP